MNDLITEINEALENVPYVGDIARQRENSEPDKDFFDILDEVRAELEGGEQPYRVMALEMRGSQRCGDCKESVMMHAYEIINPNTGEKIRITQLALHWINIHRENQYKSDRDRGYKPIDIEQLTKVLEIPYQD